LVAELVLRLAADGLQERIAKLRAALDDLEHELTRSRAPD
jgi:hypothetical protein